MKKAQKNIASTVQALIQPTADALGYVLWDVEYVKEGPNQILRITIDKPALEMEAPPEESGCESITIDDCERMHRAIDPVLDEADPIEEAYHLEVSSPGLERDLRTDAHFAASIGKEVELRLFAALDGRKVITGVLTAFDGETITVTEPGGAITPVKKSLVSKAHTVFDFSTAFH